MNLFGFEFDFKLPRCIHPSSRKLHCTQHRCRRAASTVSVRTEARSIRLIAGARLFGTKKHEWDRGHARPAAPGAARLRRGHGAGVAGAGPPPPGEPVYIILYDNIEYS